MINKKKVIKRIVMIIMLIIMLIIAVIITRLSSITNKLEIDDKFHSYNDSEIGINSGIDYKFKENMELYTNIAVFGLDNRSANNYDTGNTDTIMIVSVNNKTKNIKIVSVYRDTYLKVNTNNKYFKVNSAYSIGGVENAVRTLNENLDLNISDYVCVDWRAVINAVDKLGGVEVNITSEEQRLINKYLEETAKAAGQSAKYVQNSGNVLLNGAQATSYARIRKTAGNDYKRTSRQRIVIQAMFEKAKKTDIITLSNMCDTIFEDIKTSLSLNDIIELASDINKYNLKSTSGFPFDLTTKLIDNVGDSVIPITLESNVIELHKYLFDESNYKVSNTVYNISNTIKNDTGINETTISNNTDKFNETAGINGTAELNNKNNENTSNNDSIVPNNIIYNKFHNINILYSFYIQ